MSPVRRVLGPAMLGVLTACSSAHATDGLRERVPVTWTDGVCMIDVYRPDSPLLHLDYEIIEPTSAGLDELPDSRTHQIASYCRLPVSFETRPFWLSADDAERALDAGLIDALPSAENVVDSSLAWGPCIERITPDDARLPIDQETAAAGVDWDTSAWEPGPYRISGYTFDPPHNIWSDREGIVRVMDSTDPMENAPAAALMRVGVQTKLDPGESTVITGCASGMGGSLARVFYAADTEDPQWRELSSDIAVDDKLEFEVELPYDPELAGEPIIVEVRISDPRGRSYSSRLLYELLMSQVGSGAGGETAGEDPVEGPEGGGCSCSSEREPQRGSGSMVLLGCLLMLGGSAAGRPRRGG